MFENLGLMVTVIHDLKRILFGKDKSLLPLLFGCKLTSIMQSFMAFTSVESSSQVGVWRLLKWKFAVCLTFWEINPCDLPQFRYCIGGFSVFLLVAQHSQIELSGNLMSTCKQM
ncbi:hypothetical protein Goshw_002915, partial [Gossypium schwendimanii]|nr:hypothetical protein [Gossypium schwendimanii]